MAIPLIFAAVILFAAAYQNQMSYLAGEAEKDFSGFFPWLLAVLTIGAIGLIPKAKPVSYALMGLVFVVLFLKNGTGIFANLKNIKPIAPPAAPVAPGSVAQQSAASPGVTVSGSAQPSQGTWHNLGRVLNPSDPANIFTGDPFGLGLNK